MSRRDDNSGDLGSARREIDDIDDAILDLLKRRFQAVSRVKAIKGLDRGAGPALRPAREAQVIRRLVASAGPNLPRTLVARLWFELMAAASQFQSPISVHLPATTLRLEHRDLIRFHAGHALPVVEHADADAAFGAMAASAGDIALCPLDSGEGAVADVEDRCMTVLLAAADTDVRVLARLPFVEGTSAVAALVLGKAPFEPSGDDVTMLAARGGNAGDAGLEAAGLASAAPARTYDDGRWRVFEVSGYVAPDDQRVQRLAADAGLEELRWIGGYAGAIDLGDEHG